MKDYYKILQVHQNSSEIDIKKQFRRLALKLHPDKNDDPNATQEFIELNEAYEVLSNRWRRKHYNQLLNEQHNRVNESKRKRWENAVKNASERGRTRGKKYSKDFNYFSKKVITQTTIVIILDIILGIIFGHIDSLLTLSFLMIIGGVIVLIINWGIPELMFLGIMISILGFFWFRWQTKREFRS